MIYGSSPVPSHIWWRVSGTDASGMCQLHSYCLLFLMLHIQIQILFERLQFNHQFYCSCRDLLITSCQVQNASQFLIPKKRCDKDSCNDSVRQSQASDQSVPSGHCGRFLSSMYCLGVLHSFPNSTVMPFLGKAKPSEEIICFCWNPRAIDQVYWFQKARMCSHCRWQFLGMFLIYPQHYWLGFSMCSLGSVALINNAFVSWHTWRVNEKLSQKQTSLMFHKRVNRQSCTSLGDLCYIFLMTWALGRWKESSKQ